MPPSDDGDTRSRPTHYLPTLDGWRAVAIIGVLLCHALDAPLVEAGLEGSGLQRLAESGAWGVSIFFGLSGFLITYRLVQEWRERGRIDLAAFYRRRAVRILPPYLSYLAGVSALSAAGVIAVARVDFLSCLLFARNYLTPSSLGSTYTAHFWSLAIEEHFYFFWPFLLGLLVPRRARWVAAGLAVVVSLWRWYDLKHQLVSSVLPGVSFWLRTDIRLDALLWGAWLALLASDSRWRPVLTRVLSPRVIVVLIALFCLSVAYAGGYGWFFNFLLLALIVTGTTLHPGSLLSRGLEHPWMTWIGRLSYSLYVWQQLFLVPLRDRGGLPGLLQRLPLSLVAAFAMAVLSYYCLERPLLRLRIGQPPRLQPRMDT